MSNYRRVLALVALNADCEAVAARALQLARFHGAALALGAVVDYTPGFESDHAPFATAAQLKRAMVDDVAAKLDRLAGKVGAAGAEAIVVSGEERAAVEDLTHSWRPDLVIVGSRAPHGFNARADERRQPFDVLIVQNGRRSYPGRLIDALAAAF